VVHLPDELGTDQAPAVHDILTHQDRHNVVADLVGDEAIDSAGLAMFLDVQDELREQHGELKIAASNSVNKKNMEVTRLDQQLEVFDSVVDAVRSFRA